MTVSSLVRRVARLEARRRIGTADVVPCPRCGGSGKVRWPIEAVILADVHARLGEPTPTPSETRGCRLCAARGEVPVEVASEFVGDAETAQAWVEQRLSDIANRLGDGPTGDHSEEISETSPDA